jgi:hypothetical protein
MWTAGSLPIEPFGPSRWRLRRTRGTAMGVESYEPEAFGCAPSRSRSDRGDRGVAGRWRRAVQRRLGRRADTPPVSTVREGVCGRRATCRHGSRAVIDDVGEERREKELTRGQSFDDAHGRATARTGPRARGVDGRRGDGWWRRDGQDRATRREIGGATARREQPEVADTDEACRQHVHEEAPEESRIGGSYAKTTSPGTSRSVAVVDSTQGGHDWLVG